MEAFRQRAASAMVGCAVLAALLTGAAAETGGLTLRRYNNTAMRGAAVSTTVATTLEAVATCSAGESGEAAGDTAVCSAPSSLLLTGRLVPPTAGRYGFQLTFDPPLPYPSGEGYARLWVNDHLLYPNTTGVWQKGEKGYVAPRWIPLPAAPLDAHGAIVEIAGAAPLGSYEVRLEYVCLAMRGCAARTATLRWASFPSAYATAPFTPIPASALEPTQSAPEISRRALAAQQESGWGTFYHQSELSWVLLPESFVVELGLYRQSTGEFLPPVGLTVHKPTPSGGHSTAHPTAHTFVMKTGMHSLDQRYIEASVLWSGDTACNTSCADALNVSIATTVDENDNSQLTMTATINNPDKVVNASDYTIVLMPNFTNGRAGTVSADSTGVSGVSAGLRTSTLSLIAGTAVSLPSAQLLPPTHLVVSLSNTAPVVLSTNRSSTPADVVAKTDAYRKAELAALTKYGEWGSVVDAVQTSLMWSLVYDSKQSLVAPSYGFTGSLDFEPSTPTQDGDTADNIFEVRDVLSFSQTSS